MAPTVGLAVGTAALTADFSRFLSLVIVDYGTGIRVAAPTSVLSSMTHAARAGIVIKSGAHMERLAKVDVPAKRLPFFKVGKELKEIVNGSRHLPITGGKDDDG